MLINTNNFPVTNSLPGFTALTIVPKNTNTYTVLDMFGFSHPLNTVGGTFLRGFAAGGGTMQTPTNTITDQILLSMNGHGVTGTFWKNSAGGSVAILADSDWNDTNASTYIRFVTNPKGTLGAVEAARIQHDKSLQMQDTTLTPIRPTGASTIYSKGGSLYEIDSTGTISMLTKSATGNIFVVIPPNSTIAQAQAIIDAVPKNGNGYGLTFTLANQTNTWASSLRWEGFTQYTNIFVLGTPGYSTTTNTAQITFIDGNSLAAGNASFFFAGNSCSVLIDGIKFRVRDTSASTAITFFRHSGAATVRFCYFTADSKVNAPVGLSANLCSYATAAACVAQNLNTGFQAINGTFLFGNACLNIATLPNYGFNLVNAATLATNETCVVSGSIATYSAPLGCQVR